MSVERSELVAHNHEVLVTNPVGLFYNGLFR